MHPGGVVSWRPGSAGTAADRHNTEVSVRVRDGECTCAIAHSRRLSLPAARVTASATLAIVTSVLSVLLLRRRIRALPRDGRQPDHRRCADEACHPKRSGRRADLAAAARSCDRHKLNFRAGSVTGSVGVLAAFWATRLLPPTVTGGYVVD